MFIIVGLFLMWLFATGKWQDYINLVGGSSQSAQVSQSGNATANNVVNLFMNSSTVKNIVDTNLVGQ